MFFCSGFLVGGLAGVGLERRRGRAVPMRTVLMGFGGAVAFALLGTVGGLQGLAESLAIPERLEGVAANAPYLQSGALRLLVFVVLGGAVLWAVAAGRIGARLATAAPVAHGGADLGGVGKAFYTLAARRRDRCLIPI